MRNDLIIWGCFSVVGSFLWPILLLSAGNARNWGANSKYDHDAQNEARGMIEYPVNANYVYYYWQVQPRVLYVSVLNWLFYLTHQIGMWVLIFLAQLEKDGLREELISQSIIYSPYLSKWNKWSLVLNVVAYMLHLGKTHVWYNALATDVLESSSQSAVIMLLVLILVMSYHERGLIFGKGNSGAFKLPIRVLKRYHGYMLLI